MCDEEHLCRNIVEDLTDPVCRCAPDSTVTYVNPAFCRQFGIPREALLGQRLAQFPGLGRGAGIGDRLAALSRAQPVLAHEEWVTLADGSRRCHLITDQAIFDRAGQLVAYQSLGRDITERKLAEEALYRANAEQAAMAGQLAASLAEMRAVQAELRRARDELELRVQERTAETQRRADELAALNKAGQARVSTLDLESILHVVINEVRRILNAESASVLLCDPSAEELVFASVVGPSAAQLVGSRMPLTQGIAGWVLSEQKSTLVNNVRDEPRFYPEIDSRSGRTTQSVAAAPLIVRGATWGVVEAINKANGRFGPHDLELLEALTASAAIAFENSRLYQVEREQLRRLQESQGRLIQAEKMAALGRLTASIAHEINNPLQAVQTCLSLVGEELHEDFDPDEMQHDLKIASGEIERVSSLVRRLREFSRPAGTALQTCAVREPLDSVLDLLRKQLKSSGVVIQRHYEPDLPPVRVNPDQLKQVFVNLALNAADAMPEGGSLTISATCEQAQVWEGQAPEPAVCVRFRDTGQGIPEEMLPRIFEPFFTTKPGGTGLGLSISYEIVKSFDGVLTVSSRPGVETVFTVVLPAQAATPYHPPALADSRRQEDRGAGCSGEKRHG